MIARDGTIFSKIGLSAVAISGLGGGAVLFGWAFGVDALVRPIPGASAMNPITAICFMLAAIALLLDRKRTPVLIVIATIVVAIGTAKLVQLAIGAPTGVDQLVFSARLGRFPELPPNRMAPNTACALVLVGLAIIAALAPHRKAIFWSQAFCLLLIATALFAMIGYVLGLIALYLVPTYNAMAPHAAVGLLALAIAILTVNPDAGMMRIFGDRGPAGSIARTVLPFVLLAPIAVGLLRLQGEKLGYYGTNDGVALQVFSSVIITFALLMSSIFALYRSDCSRRARELGVARSEAGYRMAEQVAHVGHWQHDYASGIVTYSDEFYEIGGLARDVEPSVESMLSLCHPGDVAAARAMLENAARDRDDWDFSHRILRPSGELRFVRSHGVFERDIDGKPVAVFGVFADVTELELARRAAETATAAKAAFLANMSHEIRTPMHGVLGFADMLISGKLDPAEKRYAELIKESGEALLTLLNEILDLSKIEAGQMDIAAEPFDVREAVRRCVMLMEPIAQRKGIAIGAQVDFDFPAMALTDGLRLRQILLNLLGNAIKFTQDGSVRVTLQTAQDGAGTPMMTLTVSDTGIGIGKDNLGTIFDSFVQADVSTSRKYGGSGLGLSITRNLCELMGGSITLESELGTGTRAIVQLPLEEAPAVAIPAKAIEARSALPIPAPTRRHSVLLVEDVEINQELIRAMLDRLGYDVEIAANGAEAVALVRAVGEDRSRYDLILMDVQMPVMDGLTATREIRALGGMAASIPILALTASAFAAEVKQSLEAGMDEHLAKPVSLASLEAALRRWAGRAREAPGTSGPVLAVA